MVLKFPVPKGHKAKKGAPDGKAGAFLKKFATKGLMLLVFPQNPS